MEDMTRRGFMGTIGMAGALGLASMLPAAAMATEESAVEEAVDFAAREREAAQAENRPMDPIKFLTDIPRERLIEMMREEAEITEDYVTPGGKVIPAVYQRMRNHANKIGFGTGTQVADSDTAWDVFMNWFSVEEAELFCEMPLFKWFNAAELANLTGRSESECRQICDGIAERGMLWRYTRAGVPNYFIMCQIPGYWEVGQMWNCAHSSPEEAKQFIVDCDNVYGSPEDKIANMMTIRSVIHVQPASKGVVEGDLVPWTNWEDWIDQHEVFCVMPCQCRQKAETLNDGDRACKDEHPIMTCTTMGEMAQYLIEIGVGTPLTREEARAQVQSNVDHGLVIEGTVSKAGGTLCACHSDCCLFMGAVRRSKGTIPFVQYMSDYDLNYKADECLKCGACAERCPLEAIEIDEDGVPVTQSWCVRCGQCGIVCPAHARTLIPRPIYETFELPEDLVMDHTELSMTRMVQGVLKDFTGAAE